MFTLNELRLLQDWFRVAAGPGKMIYGIESRKLSEKVNALVDKIRATKATSKRSDLVHNVSKIVEGATAFLVNPSLYKDEATVNRAIGQIGIYYGRLKTLARAQVK